MLLTLFCFFIYKITSKGDRHQWAADDQERQSTDLIYKQSAYDGGQQLHERDDDGRRVRIETAGKRSAEDGHRVEVESVCARETRKEHHTTRDE